jgi:hypothetical protein
LSSGNKVCLPQFLGITQPEKGPKERKSGPNEHKRMEMGKGPKYAEDLG